MINIRIGYVITKLLVVLCCGSTMNALGEQDVIRPYDKDGDLTASGKELYAKGRDVLLSGKKLGVVILSGGEGSRLNFLHPKGLYEIEGKTLFAWHLKRLEHLYNKYNRKPSFYLFIMTSETTDKEVRAYFANKSFPFLEKIEFFKQRNEYVRDRKTRQILLLGGKSIKAPNGNGDFFRGIVTTDSFNLITQFNVISVDNVLAKICDEVALGAFSLNDLEVLSKAVEALPGENVGAFCSKNGKIAIEEYTNRNKEDNSVLGNICNHIFSSKFIRKVVKKESKRTEGNECISTLKPPVEPHEVFKKVKFTNSRNETVQPSEPNAIKSEYFIFDFFIYSKRQKNKVLCVPRDKEFSPLKNGEGSAADNARTCTEAVKRERGE